MGEWRNVWKKKNLENLEKSWKSLKIIKNLKILENSWNPQKSWNSRKISRFSFFSSIFKKNMLNKFWFLKTNILKKKLKHILFSILKKKSIWKCLKNLRFSDFRFCSPSCSSWQILRIKWFSGNVQKFQNLRFYF